METQPTHFRFQLLKQPDVLFYSFCYEKIQQRPRVPASGSSAVLHGTSQRCRAAMPASTSLFREDTALRRGAALPKHWCLRALQGMPQLQNLRSGVKRASQTSTSALPAAHVPVQNAAPRSDWRLQQPRKQQSSLLAHGIQGQYHQQERQRFRGGFNLNYFSGWSEERRGFCFVLNLEYSKESSSS